MIELKQKIIAAMFYAIAAKYEILGISDQVCNEVDRIDSTSEAIVIGAENNLCKEGQKTETPRIDSACWPGEHERLSWMLYTLAEFESGFAKNIHEGKCRTSECDPVFKILPDGTEVFVRHKARTLWQMHKSNFMTKDDWTNMVGTGFEPTMLASTIAGKELSYFKHICGTDRGALSIYATGKTCSWKEGTIRENKINKNIKNYNDEVLVSQILNSYYNCNSEDEQIILENDNMMLANKEFTESFELEQKAN